MKKIFDKYHLWTMVIGMCLGALGVHINDIEHTFYIILGAFIYAAYRTWLSD